MRKITIIFILFIFLGNVGVLWADEYISSNITKVTLFPKGALVNRKTEENVSQGVNKLLLEVNSFKLDKNSVQAKVYGKGEVYGVQFKKIHVKEFPQTKVKELRKKIDRLKEKRKNLFNQEEILNKQWNFLNSVIDFSSSQVPKELKTSMLKLQEVDKIYNYLREKFSKISDKKEKLNKEIDKLDKKIGVLKKKLDAIKSPSKKIKRGIQIIFNSKKEQKIRINASYMVRNCGWTPLYKVNVPLELKDLNLTMLTKVRQKTGEDWKNVNLTISNVVPLKGIKLPRLDSWYVDVRERRRREKLDVGKRMMSQTMEARGKPEKEKADYAQARKKELPISFEYKLPQKVSIQSKDETTILPLFSEELKGKFFYRSIPKRNSLTFLVSKTKPDRELLSGKLNVYFGGRFVGTTHLARKKPGEEFYFNLGADRGVKVNKEKIKDKIKETFFGQFDRKTVIRELAYKITAENLKDRTIDLKILDNLPVSQTDKIEIKEVKISPKPDEKDYNDEEGVNLWKIKLTPKETKEINIKFTITYPKDEHIPGL